MIIPARKNRNVKPNPALNPNLSLYHTSYVAIVHFLQPTNEVLFLHVSVCSRGGVTGERGICLQGGLPTGSRSASRGRGVCLWEREAGGLPT